MIDSLYEPYRSQWSHDGSVFILSDPHFGDSDCKLMDKNWVSPDEQVEIINSLCGVNDTFVCLGDVGDVSYIKKLNAGYKVLIRGNHDRGDSYYQRRHMHAELSIREDDPISYQESIDAMYQTAKESRHNKNSQSDVHVWCHRRTDGINVTHYNLTVDNELFNRVYGGPLFISDKIVLSHAPIDFGEYNRCFFNIHGHEHTAIQRDYHLNVAANMIGYTPINLGRLIKSGALSKVENFNKYITRKAAEG